MLRYIVVINYIEYDSSNYMTNIEKASDLELLIELMYGGKSKMIESLIDEEPIDIEFIYKILSSRTGKSFGNKFEFWYQWFLDESTNASASEKHSLKWLHDFKHDFEKLMHGA